MRRTRVGADALSYGTGPISLDVEMARRLGWPEDLINEAAAAIKLIARGAGLTADIHSRKSCEHCGAREPDPDHLPCPVCNRELVTIIPAETEVRDDLGGASEGFAYEVRVQGVREGRILMATHDLKTWPEFFDAVLSGRKSFEIRRNDRDFRVGDQLLLREYEPDANTYTGRSCVRIVRYMTQGAFGLPGDLCVLAIERPLFGPQMEDGEDARKRV